MGGPAVREGEVVAGASGEWVLTKHIGSGSFAVVWLAEGASGERRGEVVAVKVICTDKLSSKLQQSLESEVSILKRISHRNIVALQEVIETKGRLYLVMEYCSGGDLAGYIRRHKRTPEARARSLLQQLGAGLQLLWSHNLVHRDLKPQNLLLSVPGPDAVLKIADFGFARDLQPQGLAETLCGSPLYMAPEILQFHKYDAKADLWSVGTILYELLVGRPPFDGANHVQLLRNIERSEARIPDPIARQLSHPCRSLLAALLKRNPVERISFEEFFSHPFLAEGELPAEALQASDEGMASAPDPLAPGLPTIESVNLADSMLESNLPFALQRGAQPQPQPQQLRHTSPRQGAFGRAAEAGPARYTAERQASAPPTATYVSGLQSARVLMPAASAPPLPPGLGGLEDEEDYVIIDRTPSASSQASSGPRAHSQASSGGVAGHRMAAQQPFPPLQQMHQQQPQQVQQPTRQLPAASLTDAWATRGSPRGSQKSDSSFTQSMGGMTFTAGVPRLQALRRVAAVLEESAAGHARGGACADALSLRLLALQVLSAALDVAELEESAASSDGSSSAGSSGGGFPHFPIQEQMRAIAASAEEVAAVAMAEGGALPDAWELVYRAALGFARSAAVEEVLANLPASMLSYSKAGSLFFFMFAEGGVLPLEPQLHLGSKDLRRIQRYTAFIALRHRGCEIALSRSGLPTGDMTLSSNVQPPITPGQLPVA